MKNTFKNWNAEDLEELFSNYLIDSWSYSKVGSFARNEKDFEMHYIYRYPSKISATAIAGSAYHRAVEHFFKMRRIEEPVDIVDLEQKAFEYIYEVEANKWKTQKTLPTVEECQTKAVKTATALVNNFISEKSVYLSNLKSILDVEIFLNEWICVNGVEIPLPCNMRIDLVIETQDGKVVIIDHKSKASYTDDQEIAFTTGKQAIVYALGYESFSGKTVDEVWFIENKYFKNKDKSPQLKCSKVELNNDTRKLYEAMLYEPLKRMLDAVSDPDYVYTINDMDNLVDKAEIYEFWAKTMIAEVEDFAVPENKKELIQKRLKKVRDASLASINPKAISSFKQNASQFIQYDLTTKNMANEEKIQHVLRTFGILVNVAHVIEGFSSNTYLLEISAGTKISNISRYKLDIANALNVSNIRIGKDLKLHEGKSYLSIEVSKKRTKDLVFDPSLANGSKIPVGIDNYGNKIVWDIENQSTPHVLVCGATGSGKSVWIKSTIEYAKLTGVENIVIFDPKYEFIQYRESGIDVYNDIDDIETAMELLVDDMQERTKNGDRSKTLVVFDEFADAVAQSKKGNDLKVYENVIVGTYQNGLPKTKRQHTDTKKSLEQNLKMILQKGRSLGFRVIAATQRASVDVITGDAKVNLPVQICFRVPKEVDSKVVLDEPGAELLSGGGDGLIKSPEYLDIIRFQGFFKN